MRRGIVVVMDLCAPHTAPPLRKLKKCRSWGFGVKNEGFEG